MKCGLWRSNHVPVILPWRRGDQDSESMAQEAVPSREY